MKKRCRKRICSCCGELFLPDKRNYKRQKYCKKLQCRKASHTNSQKKWVISPKGNTYFCGQDNVKRVQEWRKKHPEYWKRKPLSTSIALQDSLNTQPIAREKNKSISVIFALQDSLNTQRAALVGLIANLTGNALQDDIATTLRNYENYGQQILGMRPEI